MNLSVLERLVVLKVLPKEADYTTHKIMNDLKLALSFTEEETKQFGIVTDPDKGTTGWASSGVVDIPIGEKATDIIVKAFKDLNRQGKLLVEDMSAYEKFIPTTE